MSCKSVKGYRGIPDLHGVPSQASARECNLHWSARWRNDFINSVQILNPQFTSLKISHGHAV